MKWILFILTKLTRIGLLVSHLSKLWNLHIDDFKMYHQFTAFCYTSSCDIFVKKNPFSCKIACRQKTDRCNKYVFVGDISAQVYLKWITSGTCCIPETNFECGRKRVYWRGVEWKRQMNFGGKYFKTVPVTVFMNVTIVFYENRWQVYKEGTTKAMSRNCARKTITKYKRNKINNQYQELKTW